MLQSLAVALILGTSSSLELGAEASNRPAEFMVVPAATRPTKETIATEARFDHRLPEVNFDGLRFADALAFLFGILDVKFHVNWHALEKGGISKAQAVRAHVKDIRFSIRSMLKDAETTKTRIVYDILADGSILITTADDYYANWISVQEYQIGDLVSRNGVGIPNRQERIGNLMTLIEETIDPTNWLNAGGKHSKWVVQGDHAIITTTPANHRVILNLLNQLREQRDLPLVQ